MNKTFFAPQLFIPNKTMDISFYEKAFGAVEIMRFSNDDGSVHVAELSIDGTIFHLHENASNPNLKDPEKLGGSSVLIGLFVEDVHAVFDRAIAAGAVQISPVTDWDYGYRQADIKDPFGHYWMIEKRIS